MAMMVTWPGQGGTSYSAELHELGGQFAHHPGVYIFCKENADRGWQAVYVGECENLDVCLNADLARHPRRLCLRKHGATHVCVIPLDGGKLKRSAVESDLCARLDPPCNRPGVGPGSV